MTSGENQKFRQVLTDQFDLKLRKRGRPAKEEEEKDEPISIRLHPKDRMGES